MGQTPRVLETAAIIKSAQGENNSKIARDLGLCRQTVAKIVEKSELNAIIEEGRARAIQLIPMALDTAEHRLKKHDGIMAISVLRGTGVFSNESSNVNVGVSVSVDIPRPKRD